MRVKFILPALAEAENGNYRPIKYSLFPPLGLATLAGYLRPDDEAELFDQHVEPVTTDDEPDLVAIQVYITNAVRAYAMADDYRRRGVFVVLGGLGNIRGSVIAAAFLTVLPEFLRNLGLDKYRMLVYAIVLILVMIATNNENSKEFFAGLRRKLVRSAPEKGVGDRG